MKKSFLLLCLLAVFTLGACNTETVKPQEPSVVEPNPAATETPPVEEPNKPIYFFLNNFLMGSYADEGWHSLGAPWVFGISAENNAVVQTAFLAKDIAAEPHYTLYSTDAKLGDAKQIAWQLGIDELSAFDVNVEPELGALATHYNDQFTTQNNYTHGIGLFNLPLILSGEKLDLLTMPIHGFSTYFPLNSTLGNKNEVLATNATHNPLPSKVQVLYSPTAELDALLLKELTALDIPDAPINITEHYASDFDGDGETEDILIAQTAHNDESGYPLLTKEELTGKSGSYILALYIDKGQAATLFCVATPYDAQSLTAAAKNGELQAAEHCYTLDFQGAFDLNKDGEMELCFQNNVWEGGCQLIYALDDSGQYHCVLTSPYGL